jgi:L-amino acid N-acyltransferase YncA
MAMLRLASEHDADQIAAIYTPYVRETVISFEIAPPTVEEMRDRILATVAHLPWLVCDNDGTIAGYAYAGPHGTRWGYQWSADVSAYVERQYHRMGVGRALYTSLLALLKLQGFYAAYAGVTLPNAASVGLHEAMGFAPVGVYHAVGYKSGAWHDVGWWQLSLRDRDVGPQPPIPLPQIAGTAAFEEALAGGARLLRGELAAG